MRIWQKRGFGITIIIVLLLISAYLFSRRLLPEGSVPLRDIVSYCTGDATGDGALELLVISGYGRTDVGERCGRFLLMCDASAKADMDRLGRIPPEKILDRIDLSGIKPMKVQLGDVNGDGVNEVAICVYKTTKFHPVMAKRPFFFDLKDGNLIPVWLGSRLSRPFDDYILYDIDDDALDEIISIERLENGGRVIAIYNWKGFGFEMLTQSEEYDGILRFDPDSAAQTTGIKEFSVTYSDNYKQTKLIFRLFDGRYLRVNQD